MSRRRFGNTWWGREWIDALEQRASLDPNRLPRGRTYARQHRVGALEVGPGEVGALVRGRRPDPYRVRVRVRVFDDREWERALDAIAARAAHAAALLDGELLPEVRDDVAAAGSDLLPGPGEVQPRCSCPDWADPCKHSAAVCYLVADVLDADPFALLALRGRSRAEVLAALRARRSAASPRPSARPAVRSADVEARSAYRAGNDDVDQLWAIAAGIGALRHPGRPVPLVVEPPSGSGIRARDLAALASDATARAFELATGIGDGALGLDRDLDLARRAAVHVAPNELPALARRAGIPTRRIARRAYAWRHGGREGVEVLEGTWVPDPELLDEARAALQAFGTPVRAWRNRLSAGDVQLRLGRSGRWYRFERDGDDWGLACPPHADPAALLT